MEATNLGDVPQLLQNASIVLVPIISGLLTQVIKKSFFTVRLAGEKSKVSEIGKRVLPVIALVLGVVAGLVFVPAELEFQVLVGAALGLMAIGGHDALKNLLGKSSNQL